MALIALREILQRTIFRNMVSLGLLQVANYAIPILLIPFVVRHLGVSSFGNVAYVQNIVAYLTILVNYGFDYSATREIALFRDDHVARRNTFWNIIYYKALLFVVSALLLCLLFFTWPRMQGDVRLYVVAFLINIGYVLFPNWFFQGIEEMGKMAWFNFGIKLLGSICVLAFVREATDGWLYLLLLSLAYILVGLFAFVYVLRKYNIGLSLSGVTIRKQIFVTSTPIFLNTLFGTVYSTFGLTYLGFFTSDVNLGIYAGAYKIIIAFVMLVNMPVSMSLYPVMSRKFHEAKETGWAFFQKSVCYVGGLACVASIVIFFAAPVIVSLFLGAEFMAAVPLLRLFSIVPLLVMVASMFTIQGLYAIQLERYAPYMGFVVMCICICTTVALVPRWGVFGAAVGYVVAELAELVISGTLVYLYKKK